MTAHRIVSSLYFTTRGWIKHNFSPSNVLNILCIYFIGLVIPNIRWIFVSLFLSCFLPV